MFVHGLEDVARCTICVVEDGYMVFNAGCVRSLNEWGG